MTCKLLDKLEADPGGDLRIGCPYWDEMAEIVRAVAAAVHTGSLHDNGCPECRGMNYCENCKRISRIVQACKRFEDDT